MDHTIEANANEPEQLIVPAETITESALVVAATESRPCPFPDNHDDEEVIKKPDLGAVRTDLKTPEEVRIEPLPLERKVDNPDSYPLDALGNTLGRAAKTLYNIVQAPDGICAQIILGYAVHAVQGHAIVEVDGRHYPLNNFFLSIASRSARKSEVNHNAVLVHREIQKKLLAEYQRDFEAYRAEEDVYKIECDKIKRNKSASMSEKNEALAKLREIAPQPPFHPLLVFSDSTVEGIHKAFEGGTPSKILCADEGGQIIGGHSMKSGRKTYSSTVYSKYWDGAPIPRLRGGDGISYLDGVRLSIHLMMQDRVAMEFFNDSLLRNQGLMSRFLITYPPSLTGRRGYKAENVAESPGMLAFYDRVREILSEPLPLRIDEQTGRTQNELEPRSIFLEDDAKKIWVEAYEEIEADSGRGRLFEPIEGFAGKASDHILRLAGVMALFDDIHRETISHQYVKNAITLVQYYLKERLRISSLATPDLDIENAKNLLSWIQKKGLQFVTLPDIYQSGPNRFRSKKQAEAVANTLENHRWLIREESGAVSEFSGKKSNTAWRMNHAGI